MPPKQTIEEAKKTLKKAKQTIEAAKQTIEAASKIEDNKEDKETVDQARKILVKEMEIVKNDEQIVKDALKTKPITGTIINNANAAANRASQAADKAIKAAKAIEERQKKRAERQERQEEAKKKAEEEKRKQEEAAAKRKQEEAAEEKRKQEEEAKKAKEAKEAEEEAKKKAAENITIEYCFVVDIADGFPVKTIDKSTVKYNNNTLTYKKNIYTTTDKVENKITKYTNNDIIIYLIKHKSLETQYIAYIISNEPITDTTSIDFDDNNIREIYNNYLKDLIDFSVSVIP